MKIKLSIIGGGTAGLLAAAFLDSNRYHITIYDWKSTFGRKFLVAGSGGFNLTHSEHIDQMVDRYTPSDFLNHSLRHFTNEDFIIWLESIGIPTFIGSSKRVFPIDGIKPIQVLSAINDHLKSRGVTFVYGKKFMGWDNGKIVFDEEEVVDSDINIFALGGASWSVTGSDGLWLDIFESKGINTVPFVAANCGFHVEWDKDFLSRYEGQPLKNISCRIGDQNQKGEAVITNSGIEGNAIYALSPLIQSELLSKGKAIIYIDYKPMLTREVVLSKLSESKLKVTETLRRKMNLSPLQIQLIKHDLSKQEFLDVNTLTNTIKGMPLVLTGSASVEEAISTSGGIDLSEISEHYELKKLSHNYCIGEMLDWNAPTGGYLIQACASMANYVAHHVNEL